METRTGSSVALVLPTGRGPPFEVMGSLWNNSPFTFSMKARRYRTVMVLASTIATQ